MKPCSQDTLSQISEVHHIDLFYFCRALYWGASQSKRYGSRFMEPLLSASCQQTQLWSGNGTICRPLYTWQHTSSCLPSTVVSTWPSVWQILATFKRTCTLSAHQLYSVIVRWVIALVTFYWFWSHTLHLVIHQSGLQSHVRNTVPHCVIVWCFSDPCPELEISWVLTIIGANI